MSDFDRIHALPCWNGAVEVTPLAGGLSNANYRVDDASGSHVVRFGVDFPFHHVSREREVMVARAAHAAGFAPAVEYAETGVMVTAFLEAETFGAMDVKVNPERIGQLLRAFHQRMPAFVSGPGFMFWPFHVIRDYVRTLRQDHPQFLVEAQAFESAQVALPIVFGHHDLLPANFLDDGKKLWLSAYFGAAPDIHIMRAFAAMECASLLRETLWAMVSGLFLAAPGVDYHAYTVENRERYGAALDAYQLQYGKIS
jgi:thiamine kinase-like enzyme